LFAAYSDTDRIQPQLTRTNPPRGVGTRRHKAFS
jgi:hypothetical protein